MEFGEKIHMLRKQQGLTLEAVGNIVGVGKSTVRKWESGEIANMKRDKIALLAKALGVQPGYLMGWEDNPAVASGISRDEISQLFSELTEENQDRLLDYARVLLMSQQAKLDAQE